ncbi:MAG: peptidylprolyl isomerase [Chitinophagaceae bacterium]|nr:peptidylprolyl isomerase [Chitinophagaceae bacterium]MDB5224031.1 peptidylprolyl isomerase [Chitinophagaceae bacterium]
MKKISFFCLMFLMACSATRNTTTSKLPGARIKLTTDSGVIVLRLYNKTPLHRDNFLKLVKQHYFDSLLFHRVIKNFMIQGGDPDSRHAKPAILLGNGGPSYTIPAEFDTSLFHKKGVLAAAREGDDVNPAKASSGSQFYIVQGKVFTDAGLDSVETFRLKGRKLPLSHREVYKTIGGTPHLDMNYTVFGEVESGLEVVDKIASAPRDSNNRPFTDIRMKMKILRMR